MSDPETIVNKENLRTKDMIDDHPLVRRVDGETKFGVRTKGMTGNYTKPFRDNATIGA